MQILIPDFCLVVLIGSSGSGKSTFAARFFKPSEVVSSDRCRALVADDENDQSATGDAFALVHFLAETRLRRRRLTVIDATNVRAVDRAKLLALAKSQHADVVAIVLDPGMEVCASRSATRQDRRIGPGVLKSHHQDLQNGLEKLERDGFRNVHRLGSVEEIDAVEIIRHPLPVDLRGESGPFDIIGDVHGCADELLLLLGKLGYQVEWPRPAPPAKTKGKASKTRKLAPKAKEKAATGAGAASTLGLPDDLHDLPVITAPPGRRAIFVGDIVDRGPRTPDALRIVMAMVKAQQAFCVLGNHDAKFLRWLDGRNVTLTHGLAESVAQMEGQPARFRGDVSQFLSSLAAHLWLDGGQLVVAHAGISEEMIGRISGRVREFCLYGATTGEKDEFGLPVRGNWAADYRGEALIAYGHTPMREARWENNTVCLDTGCCFGGKLTAMRWPEKELISVPAARAYATPIRPLGGGSVQTDTGA